MKDIAFEKRIDAVQGIYIVAESMEFEKFVDKKALNLSPISVNPGESTDLCGWFTKPIRYVGMYDGAAIFYLGKGGDSLFEKGGYYYDATLIFSPTRIGKSYKAGSFRDFWWNGKHWE